MTIDLAKAEWWMRQVAQQDPPSDTSEAHRLVMQELDRLRAIAVAAEEASRVIERVLDADASEGTPIWEWSEDEADRGVREVLDVGQRLAALVDGVDLP